MSAEEGSTEKSERSRLTQAERLAKDFRRQSSVPRRDADQSRRSTKLSALLTQSRKEVDTAQAIINSAAGEQVWDVSQTELRKLILPVREITAILDLLGSIHPAITVATGILKVLVQLELERRENDKNIAILFFTMCDTFSELKALDDVFKDDGPLKQALVRLLKSICEHMNKFGNFRDVYYKQNHFMHCILATRNKSKLHEFVKTFEDQKKRLHLLVTEKSAISVVKIDHAVDDLSTKVDRILACLDAQSPKDRPILDMMKQEGGETVVRQNEAVLRKIAKKFGEEVTASMRYTLHTDVEELLNSNQALYNLKIEAASVQLADAVERSTDTILVRLDAGPHELIEDEDIREVWQDMKWRISCKARHFVDAVNHYFSHKFSRHKFITGEEHPDQWTLRFLSKVIYYPAIGDAIDDDGSGYISVHETNRFFRKKPVGWTSPRWLAFWAAGWYQNTVDFERRSCYTLNWIENNGTKVLPQNRPFMQKYKNCISEIATITDAIYVDTLSYHGELGMGAGFDDLNKIRMSYMEEETKIMKEKLEKVKYRLDSIDAVNAIADSPQVEHNIMCLIFLLLQRHKRIINLAQKYVLAEQEFSDLMVTIRNVWLAFEKRLNNLLESWRQQRLDIKPQLRSFAAGMFEDWYNEYYNSDDSDDSESGSSSGSDTSAGEMELVNKEGQTLDALESLEVGETAILVYPLPVQPENTRDEVMNGIEIGEESESEVQKVTKKKTTVSKLGDRVTAVESKLGSIEKLLQKVLDVVERVEQRQSSLSSAETSMELSLDLSKCLPQKQRNGEDESSNIISDEITASPTE